MCSIKSMDRLVCGDVGFGKTEVILRASFLAVNNQKQVAIIVPTTVLAKQHYENFKERTFTADDLPSFKYYRIKLVMTSTNQVYVPRVKNLKVLALA